MATELYWPRVEGTARTLKQDNSDEEIYAHNAAGRNRHRYGYLDEADQSPIRQRMRDMREARADDGDRPDGEGRRRMGRGGERGERGDRGGRGERGPRDADTDGDNRVSRAEFLAVEHRGFARLDADSNGVITPEELDAAADERHDRRRWWRN